MTSLTTTDIETAIEWAYENNPNHTFRHIQKAESEYLKVQYLLYMFNRLLFKYYCTKSTDTLPLKIIDAFRYNCGSTTCKVKVKRKDFAGFHNIVGTYWGHPCLVAYQWLQYLQYYGYLPHTLLFWVEEPYKKTNLTDLYIKFVFVK